MGPHLALARGSVRVPPSVAVCVTRAATSALCLAALLLSILSLPAQAHAYCRESTTSSANGDCNNTQGGELLTWDRDCMTQVFNKLAFSRIPMGEAFVRKTFATSFQSWADVACTSPRTTPFLVAQASGTTSTTASEFLYDQPNESIIVVRDKGEWASMEDHDPLALALTLIWHDKKTGEILDVDMELNGGAGTFTDCTTGCKSTNIDLQNTITHEAGHLLGLGHSNVRGATMQPSTTMSPEIEKRSLESDDKMGYCSLDLPAGPCEGSTCTCPSAPIYSSHKTVNACNCNALGQSSPQRGIAAFGLMLAGAGMWRLRRRGRRINYSLCPVEQSDVCREPNAAPDRGELS